MGDLREISEDVLSCVEFSISGYLEVPKAAETIKESKEPSMYVDSLMVSAASGNSVL